MADFTTLEKKVNNTIARQLSAFLRKTTEDGGGVGVDTYAFHTLGRVRGGNISIEPVTDERDGAGRDAVLTYDISGTVVLMQTTKNEIATVGAISAPSGYDMKNGHTIFFSDSPQTESSVYDDDQSGVPNVDGFGFENILPKVTSEVNFSGDESMITIEFQCRVTRTALDNFDQTDGQLITVDA